MALRLAIIFLAVFTGVRAGGGLGYAEDVEFLQWSSLYYRGKEGLADIYPVWRRNAEFVREHNSLGLSYSVEMNKFGHMVWFLDSCNVDSYSFQRVLLFFTMQTPENLVGSPNFHRSLHFSVEVATFTTDSIPDSVDWRKKGVVPPVENQGQCSGSEMIVTLETIESLNAIETGKLVLASQQELMDCCYNCSCTGGLLSVSGYACVANIGGLAGQEYRSPDCKCLNKTYPPVVKVRGGKNVRPEGDEQALAAAVAMQPVAAAIDASHTSFQLYTSGIYDEPDCSSTQLDHAVSVVGYGSQDRKDYWIVQNSWGKLLTIAPNDLQYVIDSVWWECFTGFGREADQLR